MTIPKSKTKGVCWVERDQKWLARVQQNKVPYSLGLHDTEELAGLAILRFKKSQGKSVKSDDLAKGNKFEIINNLVHIFVISKGINHTVIVDLEDWPKVNKQNIGISTIHGINYGWITGGQFRGLLHRFILDYPDSNIDHEDRNGLNNSRSNLRLATVAENGQNLSEFNPNSKSGFRGVRWSERDQTYIAACIINQVQHYLGSFKGPEEAAKVVKEFRAKHMPFSKEAREYESNEHL